MADPSRHADSRNVFESLLRRIPGFQGYLEKEYRRESDQLARTLIVDQLQQCKGSLDQYQKSLVAAGKIDSLPRWDSIRTRLDTLQSRLKGAMRGYSGFFDFVRVDEALLERVYEHDLAMVDDAQELAATFQSLSAYPADAEAAAGKIEQRLTALSQHLDERTKLLEGLK